jgi:SPP1 gp7 family putative phage head morphogenesis protein
MKLADSKLLFDIAIRLQVFAEGVKATEARLFDAFLLDIEKEFKRVIESTNYTTLDGLTKRQLNTLVLTLRQNQTKLFATKIDEWLVRLQAFMQASLKVNRITSAYAVQQIELGDDEEDVKVPSDEEASNFIAGYFKRNPFVSLFGIGAVLLGSATLWPKLLNEPIAGIGALPKPYLQAWAASTQVAMENTIRKAYSNGMTPAQAMTEARRTLNRAKAQAVAVNNTTMQHIASVVSASIASGMFGLYQWLSVIDSSTTDICLDRNGRIYEYGKGPLPPAHTGCRSSIMPIKGATPKKPETFYAWAKRQPRDIQNAALGNKVADLLRTEKLQAKDITRLTDPKPMSISDFANSASRVLGK